MAKSLSGEEIACELTTLSVQYSTTLNLLLAVMRDCAATNNVALHTLYPLLLEIGCFLYTVDCVGDKFQIPHLSEFTTS